nr:NAD(P)-dependent oxidoreductase [Streptomyces sp. Xyl84]
MTIAVLGATGMVGSRVITEAGARGHQVLAMSRTPPRVPAHPSSYVTPLAVDVRDAHAVRAALTGHAADGAAPHVVAVRDADVRDPAVGDPAAPDPAVSPVADVVVLAVRTEPADAEFLVGATRTVLDAAAPLGIRVLVVGGAGALRSPGGDGPLVADDPVHVPAGLRDVAAAGVAQLRACQAHTGADWVYLSPPALLRPGIRTGRYRRGTDTLLTGAGGRSWISAEDLAVAVVDELETPGRDRHITVAHEDRGQGPEPEPEPELSRKPA